MAKRNTPKRANVMAHVATRKISIDDFGLIGLLPNPDIVLRKAGKDHEVYQEIATDAHLSSVMEQRRSGVLSLEWEVDRGKAKSRQAKAIQTAFERLNMPRIMQEMLDGRFYGYQPLEVMWEVQGGLILPRDIVGKPARWFRYNDENELRMITRSEMVIGMELPPRKFLVARNGATYANPYGEALLSKCFWPVKFKNGGIKFWVTFVEKYATPFAVGKVPRNAGEAEYTKMLDMLESIISDGVAAIPDDGAIELLEAAGKSASADIFDKLVDYMDKQISKAIVGHSAAADSTPGRLGGEDTTQEVRQDLVDADKRLVEELFNHLIGWIYEMNFGTGERPQFSLFEEQDIDQPRATRDKTLVDTGQVRLTKKYYQEAYGFEDDDIIVKEEFEDPKPVAPIPGQARNFAESRRETPYAGQDAVDRMVDAITPEQLRQMSQGLVKPILDLFAHSADYEEAMEKLLTVFPQMDTRQAEDLLARAEFLGEALGQVDV